MAQLVKVQNSQFGAITCDYYGNGKGEFFMTRQQIGEALEYDFPQQTLAKLHARHKDRLDKFSVLVKMTTTDGKAYDTFLYSAKGVYEICRWSRQPKADAFYDHVYDILEGLRLGYLKLSVERESPHWQQTRLASKMNRRMETDIIKDFVDYAIAQGSEHADRYYCLFSKLADEAVGIQPKQRDAATITQLNSLTLVESILANIIQACMAQDKPYKDVYKECKTRLSEFRKMVQVEFVAVPLLQATAPSSA